MSNLDILSFDHPYRRLRLPGNPPIKLRPSLGKGWGVFATGKIEKGSRILSEKSLFIIPKPHTAITEEDILMALRDLSSSQKAEFLLLRDNGSRVFTNVSEAFAENSFCITTSELSIPLGHGLFPLHSRFNHSCIPNSKIPTTSGDVISIFATRDIDAEEEITFCYNTDFECRTRYERHQALRFTCGCRACCLGIPLQKLSDIRRRLIRGLQYLTLGVDLDGQKQDSRFPIIVDQELRSAAESFSIPISSRFVYGLLTIFFIEEEGLLDYLLIKRLEPGLISTASFFRLEPNQRIAEFALSQSSWLEKLLEGFKLYGRKDVADSEINQLLQGLRLLS